MIAKPSHNIQRAVKSACYRAHREYIVCKIPPQKDDEEVTMKYFPINHNRWKAFIALPIDGSDAQHKNQLKNYVFSLLNDSSLSVDDVQDCVNSSIRKFESKSEKIEGKSIFNIIEI